ncbi:signal transduction histidine kinase [Dysgonomonas sp. PFB1-18]|uniref:tetratricopeptide repeat-containing sensor histidine kinase n=1 Tax=unclassified Dysgonomonas TaxID=2630389 RepID=UPI002474EE56|nr:MULTISPECIES: ATP-binding protein [unclassified Dysgonomonas]MDH6310876.1 signal transduction histidine kinase [Dysgonomonas sp. PF1-14]MDH6340686.1 signal transduction histidine kinase [Dysgonomonas sp. PF1-16]MDH6382346.1 signal transduction histidine kinase [Dysgonomonas sp. PFB1-18]MDH6399696.1 signal transduction histidine kinase [Dysgonomonas sp. PF1-23]
MRILLFSIFIIFTSHITAAHPHKQKIDSLHLALQKQKDDSTKVLTYIALSNYSYHACPDSMLIYARKGLELSEKIKWEIGIGHNYYLLGLYYINKEGLSQRDKALDYTLKAVSHLKDKKTLTHAYATLTTLYAHEKEFDKALNYANDALQLVQNDPGLTVYATINMGDLYKYMEQRSKAKEYYLKALKLLDKSEVELDNKLYLQLTALYLTAANRDTTYTDIQESYKYITKAKQLYETSCHYRHETLYSRILATLGDVIVDIVNKDSVLTRSSKNRLLDDAEKYLLKSLDIDISTGDSLQIVNRYRVLYYIEKEKGDYKKALEYSEKWFEGYNLYYSQENKNKIATVEKEYQAREFQYQIKSKEEQLRYIVIFALLLIVVVVLLLIFNQVRKRKNLQLSMLNEELGKRNAELTEANNMKIKLLGIINHDLRKPVSHLISYLHLRKNLPEEMSQERQRMTEERTLVLAEELLQNMEELIFWCKSQMNNFHPHMEKVKLSDLFSGVQSFFDNKDNVRFEFQVDFSITTDINIMKTIIRNLTFNAIRAARKIKREPDVRWFTQSDGDNAMLTIVDNGGGMSLDNIMILKEGANTISISQGLGLHIIHDLAKSIHCKIEVISTDNIGTTIKLIQKITGVTPFIRTK